MSKGNNSKLISRQFLKIFIIGKLKIKLNNQELFKDLIQSGGKIIINIKKINNT